MSQTSALNRFKILFLVTISTLYSCGTTNTIVKEPYIVANSRQQQNLYYLPFAPNVPLLKEKNQISTSLQLSTSYENFSNSSVLDRYNLGYVNSKVFSIKTGVDLQAAYMLGKHMGIMSSYSFGNSQSPNIDYVYGKSSSGDSLFTYKGQNHLKYNHFEIGAGYIASSDKYWHFETYGGYGFSKLNNRLHTGRLNLNNNYFFIQPTIAYAVETKNNYTIQFALVSKFIGNRFTVTNPSFAKDRELFTNSQVQLLEDRPFHIFWEPGMLFRFGWKNVLLHTGYSFSASISDRKLQRGKENFSIGLNVRFKTKK